MLEPICYRRHVFRYRLITRHLLDVHDIYQMAWPITCNFHDDNSETYRHSDTY